jgi:hypothetical protein
LTLTASAGCSDKNVALPVRDTLPEGATQTVPNEFVATVERVNTVSTEIDLRSDDGRTRVVGYSADTRVIYRGHEYPISRLEAGDIVATELRQDARGNYYTGLIRVEENFQDRSQRWWNTAGMGHQVE